MNQTNLVDLNLQAKTPCSIRDCRTVAVAGGAVLPLCVEHREQVVIDLATYLVHRTFSTRVSETPDTDDLIDWLRLDRPRPGIAA